MMKRRLAAALLMLSLAAPGVSAAQGYRAHGPGRDGGYGMHGGVGQRGGFEGRGGGFEERGGYPGRGAFPGRGGYPARGGFDRGPSDERGIGPNPRWSGPQGRALAPNPNQGLGRPGPFMRRGGPPVGFPLGREGREGWTRGQYLPPEARGEMILDYGRYHLRRPPRGYYWYRAGDDYVLAAVATGVIFEVIQGDGY